VAPVRDQHGAGDLGIATIYPDGKIEIQIHSEMALVVLRNMLTCGAAEGIFIGLHSLKNQEKEKQDGTS
jgi:hypothetical protein